MIGNDLIRAAELGWRSTAEVAQHFGMPLMQGAWLIRELGIKPSWQRNGGTGLYWSPEQVEQIRQALIARLQALGPQHD